MRKVGDGEGSRYLANGVRNLGLVTDIAGVKGSVVIALDDVKDSDGVTTRDQSFNYVTTEETAAADDKKRVALL
jgi:hypothetical protein